MLGSEFMQGKLEERFSPLSNRRKSVQKCTLPDYWYPFCSGDNAVCSLDMVRLRLRFEGESKGEELDRLAERLPVICEYRSWVARVKPGGWRVLHNFGFGESSASLGIGLIGASCSIDMAVGFIEFNPNKLADNPEFVSLLGLIASYVSRAELVRFDLAVDVAVPRKDVHLVKDGRKYSCEVSSSVTEYLGRRNAAGFVKVYDKKAESKLDVPLTRIELTCDGRWTLQDIGNKWPRVYSVDNRLVKLNRVNTMAVLLLCELMDTGVSPEPYLAAVDKRTRAKIRAALEGPVIDFPSDGAMAVMLQAVAWAELLGAEGL